MSRDEFDLFVAKMEAVKRQMRDEINRSLFADGARGASIPVVRASRLAVAWASVRAYTVTLWRALRGDDPYAHEWDDY